MERRAFIGILAGTLLAGANVADAQQSGKPWRVGFLGGGVRPPNGAVPAPLREQLQSLGYTEGKDIVYEGLWAGGRIERLHELAVELLSSKPDMIVTLGAPGSEAAKQASSTIPIVALSAGDMLETGPNRYFLIINVKTAGNLGLAVPQSLLVRADHIVQ